MLFQTVVRWRLLITPYENQFLLALILTITVETIVLLSLIRLIFKIDKKRIRTSLILFSGFFSSFSTLPYLWFIFPFYISPYILFVALGETFVVLTEAVIYFFILKISMKKALATSLICNIISFLFGFIFLLI